MSRLEVALLLSLLCGGCVAFDYDRGGGRCEVHGDQLRQDVVPVVGGMPLPAPGYPNACSAVNRGCTWERQWYEPDRALVHYCPTCRTGRAEYLQKLFQDAETRAAEARAAQ